jgi:hypothetical protein
VYTSRMKPNDFEHLTQELRRHEAYLAEAQRLSHTGSFGWKPATGEIVWSDETYRIFEYDRAEKPTLDMVFQRIHPDDRALAQQVIENVSRSTDFEHEYRLVMPGGAIKHIRVRAHALSDSSDNIEVIGAVTDTTDRKAADGRRHFGNLLRERRWQDSRGQSGISTNVAIRTSGSRLRSIALGGHNAGRLARARRTGPGRVP